MALFVAVSALTGGAVLRAGLRVFLGAGRRPPAPSGEQTSGGDEQPETEVDTGGRTPVTMVVAAALLLAGGLAVGLVPALASGAARGAELFTDRAGYLAQVLSGTVPPPPVASPAVAWTPPGVLLGLLSTLLALGVAGVGIRGPAPRGVRAAGGAALRVLQRLHSGHVGDYVAWLFVGAAVMAALIGLPLR
jgi:multicomponent Na+:H+ antiporter subunit D